VSIRTTGTVCLYKVIKDDRPVTGNKEDVVGLGGYLVPEVVSLEANPYRMRICMPGANTAA